MDKIIYKTVTINDNMMLVVQALIDKQDEIVDKLNKSDKSVDDIVSGRTKIVTEG